MHNSIHRSIALSACASLFLGGSFAQTQVFVGSSVAGNSDPWFLIDGDTGLLIDQGSSPRTNNTDGAFFHPESSELVVASALGEEVTSAPIVGLSPDFQNPLFQTAISGGAVSGCFYDGNFERIFTQSRNSSGGTAHILDGDPLSPTYGAVLHTVAYPVGSLKFAVSEDSSLLTVPPVAFSGSVPIIDVDPDSAGFLSVTDTATTTIPANSLGVGAMFSPDNRFLSVLVFTFGGGTSVAKYDRQTQTWIDGVDVLPGFQGFPLPIGVPLGFAPIRGSEAALVADAGGTLGLLVLPGDNPDDWSFTPLQSFLGDLDGIALSSDGARLAIGLSDPPRLIVADASTGTILSETALPAGTQGLSTIAWFDDGLNAVAYCGPGEINSTGASGELTAAGSSMVSSNDLAMTASDLPPMSFGFLITSLTQGFVANPGGSQGNLCVTGLIGRFVGPGQIRQASAAGDWTLVTDLTQQPQPTGLVSIAVGDTWNYQAWYRDSVGGQASSNFTNGVTINFR